MRIALLLACVLLVGCADRRMANHARQCQAAGLAPQTEAHARCVVDLERDYRAFWDAQLTPR